MVEMLKETGVVPDFSELFRDDRRDGETTLRQCQLVMIRMLKVLDHICKQNRIPYWMTAGTLIGALRHRGMIPWDGDIDVAMTEESHAAFCAVAWQLPQDIFFQTTATDPWYTTTITSKLRDRYSNYTEWLRTNPDAKWHNGLQVDIIIYPRNEQGRLVNPFRKTEYEHHEIFPLAEVEFEGSLLMAPRNPGSYIARRYGDYMQLPPVEARFPHEGRADPFNPCLHPESRPYPHAKAQSAPGD